MAQLSNRQWQTDIVVTRRVIGERTLYFPRNQRTVQRLYRIDSCKCGFELEELPRNTRVVDENDNILTGP